MVAKCCQAICELLSSSLRVMRMPVECNSEQQNNIRIAQESKYIRAVNALTTSRKGSSWDSAE